MEQETYPHQYLVQTYYPSGDLAGFAYYDNWDDAIAAYRRSKQHVSITDCRTDREKYPHLPRV